MSLVLLFHYLLLNVFQMLIHPSSGAGDLFYELLHGLYGSGSMCVGVALWWCGIRMQAETLVLQPASDTTPPQRNTNTHRTRTIQPMQ